MAKLRMLLASEAPAVIVADGGFKTPFFDACLRHGFDFVIRLRGSGMVDTTQLSNGSGRIAFSRLFRSALPFARYLFDAVPYATTRSRMHRIVLGPKVGRLTRSNDGYYKRRSLEPFLLATSLQGYPAGQIVRSYRSRMQIEETFRDAKNPRMGWALTFSRSRDQDRLNNLVLLTALAFFAVFLAGLDSERQGVAKHYQANSTTARRVLSLFTLGNLVIARRRTPLPTRALSAVLFFLSPTPLPLQLSLDFTAGPYVPET